MEKYDVIIVGGGILGAMTARELSRYNLDAAVLERAYDVGEGATKANSGVLAAGFHPRAGSLKGISCVRGNAMYKQLCQELDVDVKCVGSLFVAFHKEGLATLEEKRQRGLVNGTPGMQMVDGYEARKMEPGLSPKVLQALYAPTTAIISPFQLIFATAQSANINGVEFMFDTAVENIEDTGEYYLVHTNKGTMKSRYVVNTAGESACEVERFVRYADLIIKPRRGQFYVLDKQGADGPKHVLYQAQENDEGGTLIAPTVEGNVLIGPTAENVSGFNRTETTAKGLAHLEKVAKKLLPDLDIERVITCFAGVRANIKNVVKEEKDFVIRRSAPRMVSALGIKNPGMTAAPYLASLIVSLLKEEGLNLEKNPLFNPYFKRHRKFVNQELTIQNILLEQNNSFGTVVCRCESITEGDILQILSEPLPPKSLNGIKKRLRTGMGRCQGGFCIPRVIETLSREWGIPPEQVLKSTKASELIKGRVKP